MSGDQDNHTLYVYSDIATKGQIAKVIIDALKQYESKTGDKVDMEFYINRVENRAYEPIGLSFIFLTSPKTYYLLLGKNIDGSERYEYILDDSKYEDHQVTSEEPIAVKNLICDCDWSDLSDDVRFDKILVKKQVKRSLPSLVDIAPIILSEDQKKSQIQEIINRNINNPNFRVADIKINPEIKLKLDRATIISLDDIYLHNVLKCKEVPFWITKDDLKREFNPYASDNKSIRFHIIGGKKIKDSYPIIDLNNDSGTAFITFDPDTKDAQFALHMTKKIYLTKTVNNETKHVTLMFNHSFRAKNQTNEKFIRNKPKYNKPGQVNSNVKAKFINVKLNNRNIDNPHSNEKIRDKEEMNN